MSERPSIALACAPSSERASVLEWLTGSGYDPVAVPDLSLLDEDMHTNAIEAVIVDMAFLPRESDVSGLVRRLGNNRPLLVLGDAGRLPATLLGELSVVARPITREALLLSVGLALAEGRPARKSPRRSIEPIPAAAHGTAATVVEASAGGVGIEVTSARPTVLPPFFSLRIAAFGVHVVVKRAWMAPVAPGVMRCGGTVEGDLPGATRSWPEFAREAPEPLGAGRGRLVVL